VLEAQGATLTGASAGMWRKLISCMLAGLTIIGSAGLFILGLMGHWEPGVPFALAPDIRIGNGHRLAMG
jgi:hypothetical protein